MKCNCDNDQKIIKHVEGNTLTCAIPLQDRITRFVDGEKVTTVEDFYPLDTDTVTVRLTTGFTTIIPMECQVTDNVVTFTDNGTLPSAHYGIEITVVRASGDKKRYYSEYEINIVDETSEAGIPDDIEYDVETYDLEAAVFDMMRGYSAYEIWLQQGHTGTEEDFLEWLSGQGQIDAKIEEVYETIAREYVRKVTGMGLSQNDFTNILKTKLESLENYDDTQVRALITSLTNRLDTLVDGDVTQAIETFNEVIAFLDGLSDTQNLAEIISSIQSEIATKANAATTYTKTEADTKFATNETVNSAAFLGSESGSSTTANFDAQTDTVWNIPQSLGSAAKAQARANIGAQETLVSGTNVKTVNNESILGSGNITIQGGGGGDVNIIESITFNGSDVPVDASKNAAITYSAPVTSVNGNTGAVTVSVPTKVSDLTNDSGFITSYTETDPIFTASAAHDITSNDISNWNSKTSNVGTITGITMNGASKGTSGVVDLGTVITSHQDISGKEDKITIVAASGTTLTAEVGKYYTLSSVGTLAITLPTIASGTTKVQTVTFYIAAGSTPGVTFTSSHTIIYPTDYKIEANGLYEIGAAWNGIGWIIGQLTLEIPT